jgi:hypothetical protein
MSKIVQAFLSGMFFTFILDFFLFLGLQLHYIEALEIDIYYNIFFVDNQNFYLFFFLSLLLGYITLYLSHTISLIVVGTLFILSSATLIEPIGKRVGEELFMQKDMTLYTKRFQYKGDIYYDGRKDIYFYDHRLEKMLKIEKNKIKELH